MKRILVSALALLFVLLSFAGCDKRYKKIDVPKELQIDPQALSENTDEIMDIDDTTPLLTALPEQGLYIYYTDRTIRSGVLVKYDGLIQYFPWRFTPERARPDVYIADYNGDGEKDIAFTYVYETGATTECENLHLLLRNGNKFEDRLYTGEKASIQCGNHLVVYAEEDGRYIAYLDGEPSEFSLPGHENYIGLDFKHKQDFTLGETITVELEPGLMYAQEMKPVYGALDYTARLELTDKDIFQVEPQLTLAAEETASP